MGYAYCIHYNRKYKGKRHYTGYAETAETLARRMVAHCQGRGARILKAVAKAGIGWQVAHVWGDVDRSFERWLKKKKGASVYCDICKGRR